MLNELFTNSYARDLAIRDHCQEILTIWEAIVVCKNSEELLKQTVLEQHYENELADLYLLLHEHFVAAPGYKAVVAARRKKFKTKGEET